MGRHNDKLTEMEINERIAHKNCKILYETYSASQNIATFFDFEYGEFTATASKVLHSTKTHPIRAQLRKKDVHRKYRTKDEINNILFKNNRKCIMLSELFGSIDDKADFMDDDFGVFNSVIYKVMIGHDHPARGNLKRKSTVMERYGVEYYSQVDGFKAQITRTFQSRYGVDHNMKHPEMALNNARSQNKVTKIVHWQTAAELVCVGSYESSVVDYLNYNKIDFCWQPKIFSLRSGRTYRPDLYLTKEDLWIEIKGYMRDDAREKWTEFREMQPNSELWDKHQLLRLGIIFNSNGKAKYD